MFPQSNDMKAVDSRYHRERERARRTAMSPAEFSDQERTRWDLDDAGITGADNPRTWFVGDPLTIGSDEHYDVREEGRR